MAKLTAFSDTHELFPEFEHATQYAVFAGDYQKHDREGPEDWRPIATNFLSWYSKQPFEFKFLVAGNHDQAYWFDKEWFHEECLKYRIIDLGPEYIRNYGGICFFGTPFLYTHKRNDKLIEYLPDDRESFDILVTHVPPYGVYDFCAGDMLNLGSQYLRSYVNLGKPGMHIFGHIHEGYGKGKPFFNVALKDMDGKKGLTKKPIVLDVTHLKQRRTNILNAR